jgi:arginyl-tRNA synthetase
MLEKLIISKTVEACKKLYDTDIPFEVLSVQKTIPAFKEQGDLTLVVFPIVKFSRKSPDVTAAEIGEYLKNEIAHIKSFGVVKGFLNLMIEDNFWLEFLKENCPDSNFGFKRTDENSEPVLVEFSSPNTNKPLHLGHIRNNLLGNSVSEILKANGQNVKKVNLVNDRGIHICKSMVAYEKWGEEETPESSGMKGDHLVGKYYVLFDQEALKEAKEKQDFLFGILPKYATKDEWVGNGKNNIKFNIDLESIKKSYFDEYKEVLDYIDIKDFEIFRMKIEDHIQYHQNAVFIDPNIINKLKLNSKLFKEAQEMLVKWESGDSEIRELWGKMNSWVYKGFDVTYKNLGIDFDKTYYESGTYLLGKDFVLKALAEQKLIKKDDGSVWANLTSEGLDEKILLRSDGTSVYMTQDIGTAQLRFEDYHPRKMVYVVGNEQNYHFDVLKKVLKLMGKNYADSIYHLSYGMVELPEGKMKSREGTVVDADELISEMTLTAKEMTEELGKTDDFTFEQAENLYRIIGLGALKYFILKVDPEKNMVFNPKESIDFNGNTGPFLQYTYARIKSLLRKADVLETTYSFRTDLVILNEEKELLKLVYEFPQVVNEAGAKYSPAIVANYIYEIAKAYNHFYQKIPVLKETDKELGSFRLILSEFTGEIIKKSLALLGIEVPERM